MESKIHNIQNRNRLVDTENKLSGFPFPCTRGDPQGSPRVQEVPDHCPAFSYFRETKHPLKSPDANL